MWLSSPPMDDQSRDGSTATGSIAGWRLPPPARAAAPSAALPPTLPPPARASARSFRRAYREVGGRRASPPVTPIGRDKKSRAPAPKPRPAPVAVAPVAPLSPLRRARPAAAAAEPPPRRSASTAPADEESEDESGDGEEDDEEEEGKKAGPPASWPSSDEELEDPGEASETRSNVPGGDARRPPLLPPALPLRRPPGRRPWRALPVGDATGGGDERR